jgi:mRNA interferase MazF
MQRGDVYDVRFDPVEDSEQGGTRPAVIVSRDAINRSSPVIVVVPLTRAVHVKRQYPNNVRLAKGQGGLTADSVALCGQVRALSTDRLLRQRGHLLADVMRQIDDALRITLDL